VKLSQGVEWGLHCVALLAHAPDGGTVPREELAGHYGLRESYLAKHLQSLTRAGVLNASTGPKGGYRLGRPASQITVLDVVEAIEGRARPFVCQEIRQHGSGALRPEDCIRQCAINAVMDAADDAWRASLASVTIAGIADGIPAWIRDRNRARLAEVVR
jgi:Rrf2 family protein